jgi:hypothetical protein
MAPEKHASIGPQLLSPATTPIAAPNWPKINAGKRSASSGNAETGSVFAIKKTAPRSFPE